MAASRQLWRASSWHVAGLSLIKMLFGAFLAFMLSVSEYLLVSNTSGLALAIAGIFKVKVYVKSVSCRFLLPEVRILIILVKPNEQMVLDMLLLQVMATLQAISHLSFSFSCDSKFLCGKSLGKRRTPVKLQ